MGSIHRLLVYCWIPITVVEYHLQSVDILQTLTVKTDTNVQTTVIISSFCVSLTESKVKALC